MLCKKIVLLYSLPQSNCICDALPQFNDGAKGRYHLFIKEIRTTETVENEKLLLLKSPQITKSSIIYCNQRKRKTITQSKKIYQRHFPNVSFVKNTFADDDDLQIILNKF